MSLKDKVAPKLVYMVLTLCLFIILSIFEGVIFAQEPENQKAKSDTNSSLIHAVGQAIQNNPGLNAGQAGIRIAEPSASTESFWSQSVFNSVDISLYLPATKHNKRRVANHSYIAQEVSVLSEREGNWRFSITTKDCQYHTNIAGAQLLDAPTKLNLPLSLIILPHYKPKQALRWHMII